MQISEPRARALIQRGELRSLQFDAAARAIAEGRAGEGQHAEDS